MNTDITARCRLRLQKWCITWDASAYYIAVDHQGNDELTSISTAVVGKDLHFCCLVHFSTVFFQILLQSPLSEIYGFWVPAHCFLLKDAHPKKLPGVLPLPLLQQGPHAVPMSTIKNGTTTPYWCLQAGPWSAMSIHSRCHSAPHCSVLRVIHSAQHGPLEGTCPLAYFYP